MKKKIKKIKIGLDTDSEMIFYRFERPKPQIVILAEKINEIIDHLNSSNSPKQ